MAMLRQNQMGILLKGTVKDNGLRFASYLGIKTDGKVTVHEDSLTVTGASYATLLLSAKTNFAQNPKTNYRKDIDLEKTVKGIVEAASGKDYETLKKGPYQKTIKASLTALN